MDIDPLRIGDAGACSVTTVSSKRKRSNAGLGVFAARALQKGEVAGSYYGSLV